jgi:hypothetical protein
VLAGLEAILLVAEAPSPVEAVHRWEQQRVKRYGRTWVTFLDRQ